MNLKRAKIQYVTKKVKCNNIIKQLLTLMMLQKKT